MILADTAAVAAFASGLLGREVKPDNIRHWAMRHPSELPKRGRRNGRTLYALEDAEALAERMKQRVKGSRT